jgi:UDP-glucose 4-epimerase
MLDWFQRVHGLHYASLRYFNAAGAAGAQGEDHRPESHLIPLALEVAAGKRDHIAIYGTDYPTVDGTCVRDYIHVADLANAHLRVLEALKDRDKLIYNLGNGEGFTVRQVIDMVRRITKHPVPARETERRPGDPQVLVASSHKIQSELNWSARFPDLEAIVRSAWEWRCTHPDGYGD